MIVQVFALGVNLVSHVFGVMPDPPDKRGSPPRLPRQAKEVDSGLIGDPTLMHRRARLIKGIDF